MGFNSLTTIMLSSENLARSYLVFQQKNLKQTIKMQDVPLYESN